MARIGEWLRRTKETGAEEMATVKPPGDDHHRRTLA